MKRKHHIKQRSTASTARMINSFSIKSRIVGRANTSEYFSLKSEVTAMKEGKLYVHRY